MKAIGYLSVPLILLLALAGEVSAQSNEESGVQELEETIRVLELRVAELEEQLRAQSASTSVASDKAGWRKLQRGMSETDVEKLLGSPSKIDAFGPFTTWYFNFPNGGQVQFDAETGTVRGWKEP